MSQSGKMKCKERRVQDTSSGRSHALRHITVSGLTLLSLFSTPPPWTRHRYIHDPVTHGKEDTSTQGLRKEVGKVVDGCDERAQGLVKVVITGARRHVAIPASSPPST